MSEGRKQYEVVYDVYRRTGSIPETANELGLTLNHVRAQIKYYEQKTGRMMKIGHLREEDIDLIKPSGLETKDEKVKWHEIIDVAERVEDINTRVNPRTTEITHQLPSKYPPVIINSSDWHIGSHGVDYKSYMEKMKYILETPYVFMIVAGDIIQNMPASFRNALPSMNQVIGKRLQYAFLQDILMELIDNGKLLAATWGNHDAEMDEKLVSNSFIGFVLNNLVKNDKLYLPVGGFVNIEFDTGVNYRFHVTHKYRGNSMYNPVHSNNRAMREKGLTYNSSTDMMRIVDATIQGHTHTPSYAWVPFYDTFVYHIKTGTYQETGEYGDRFFSSTDVVHFPSMVLNPYEKEIMVFPNSHQAASYGEFLREKHSSKSITVE